MSPASDFYKKLALDCSSQQIAVDLFAFGGQFMDLTTICMLPEDREGGSVDRKLSFFIFVQPASPSFHRGRFSTTQSFTTRERYHDRNLRKISSEYKIFLFV